MPNFEVKSLSIAAVVLAAILAQGAKAATTDLNVTMSASLSSLPSNSSIQVLDLGQARTNGLVASQELYFGQGNTITFGTASGLSSGVYHGTTTATAAAPYTPSGPQTTNYLAAEVNNNVTISYAQNQQYFGLNWGSVDSYNTLNFYEGSTLVASYSGSQITTAQGSQGANGSYFVNFDFSNGATYNKVVAVDTKLAAFEFDMVASSTQSVPLTSAPSAAAPTLVAVYANAAQTQLLPGEAPLPALGSSPLAAIALAGGAVVARRRRAPRAQAHGLD